MPSQDPMFSAEDTPANPSAKPVKGKAKKTHDTFSPGSPKPFANYDPATQSWKTYPVISLWDSEPYKGSWPRSGMTQDGIAYQLPPSAPRTSATAFSSSLHHGPNSDGLWPIATTQDHATRYAQGGMPLGMAARLFPTPTSTANMDSPNERKKWPWLFPTPVASGGLDGGSKARRKAKIMNESGIEVPQTGRLNPRWVEWLMGFPIGWTDLEGSETPSSHKSPNTSEGS